MSRLNGASWPGRAGLLGSLVLFCAALFCNTRHNHFPIAYHYDEPGKVAQAMSGNFRLNQPAVMLETAAAAAKLLGASDQPQTVGEIGRWLSALYAAGAVTILAVLAGRIARMRAALLAALLLFPQRQIILAAHYFKEDAILLLGLAVAWGALLAFLEKPGQLRGALLGAACALALSAKFIGALMLIPAGLALCLEKAPGLAKPTNRWRATASFLGTLVVVAALLNLRALLHPGTFLAGFSEQLEAVGHGNGGTGGKLPNWRNLGMCFLEVTPVLLALYALFIVRLARERAPLKLWLLALFPAGYAGALIFSAIGAIRYSLPVVAFSAVIAALALDGLFAYAQKVTTPRRALCWLSCLALVGIAGGWEWWRGVEVWRGFAHDSRQEMAQFVAAMPDPPAYLAEDDLVQLGRLPALAAPMKLLSTNFVADAGTLTELRQRGVTHVAICRLTYRRFFETSKVTQGWAQADFARRKQFYADLQRNGDCIFATPLGRPDILHPGLELYDIRRTK